MSEIKWQIEKFEHIKEWIIAFLDGVQCQTRKL